MFINLTNHPSEKWSEEQIKAARCYGEIADIPFPSIKPTASTNDIIELAELMIDKIKSIDSNPTVHVMGEMTFTYHVVSRLKALGITCVASTTKRNIIITPDGKEIPDFKFVQFREY